jgi:hypothetical protein
MEKVNIPTPSKRATPSPVQNHRNPCESRLIRVTLSRGRPSATVKVFAGNRSASAVPERIATIKKIGANFTTELKAEITTENLRGMSDKILS